MTDSYDIDEPSDHVSAPDIDNTPRYVDEAVYDIDKFYEMNPETEDLIFGSELRDNMRVVIEDNMCRADTEHMHSRYDSERARENNRWCLVTELRCRYVGGDNTLVSFIGLYDDGTKKSRTFNESYCWIVKKESIPVAMAERAALLS